ncbi:glucose/arabinose dehydrogenase [Luteibacter sp. 621]|uniref:PQQ-dependent sugar dehydrogenase n=1 Tax=Luteibacter sp. 621 TaxID=3373916 RepID=UPI003D1D65D8
MRAIPGRLTMWAPKTTGSDPMRHRQALVLLVCSVALLPGAFAATNPPTSLPATQSIATLPDMTLSTAHRFERVGFDLRVPWELAFLPDGALIFTERDGHVRLLGQGRGAEPALRNAVALGNKMGMLGLVLDPDFSRNHFVYVAYDYVIGDADANEGVRRFKLRVARYRLDRDALVEPHTLIEGIPAATNHTGCRLVFGPDGRLYITTGDADEPAKAQQLGELNGKILRLERDGSVPADNPFVHTPGARPEVWSYGHRNPQGLAFDPRTGTLFESEHGPNGGDEINIIERGANYGWPVIDHAATQQGMRSPLLEFSPSIAPGKVMLYQGSAFPELKGKLIVALLRGEGLLVLDRDGNRLSNPRRLFFRGFGRIRAVTASPEGYLYFSTSQYDPAEGQPRPDDDLIVRLVPASAPKAYPAIEPRHVEAATQPLSPTQRAIATHCAACHGPDLRGGSAPNLVERKFAYVTDRASLKALMVNGLRDKGMPPNPAITPEEQALIATYLQDERANQ